MKLVVHVWRVMRFGMRCISKSRTDSLRTPNVDDSALPFAHARMTTSSQCLRCQQRCDGAQRLRLVDRELSLDAIASKPPAGSASLSMPRAARLRVPQGADQHRAQNRERHKRVAPCAPAKLVKYVT